MHAAGFVLTIALYYRGRKGNHLGRHIIAKPKQTSKRPKPIPRGFGMTHGSMTQSRQQWRVDCGMTSASGAEFCHLISGFVDMPGATIEHQQRQQERQ